MAAAARLFFALMHPVLLRMPLFGGEFVLHGFGVFVALGCAAAIFFAMSDARRRGENPELIRDLCFWTLIAGLVGARAVYVLSSGRMAWDDCLDAAGDGRGLLAIVSACTRPLHIWEGGLVFYGGMAGGAAAAWLYGRGVGLRFARTADILAPSLALGHVLGRIGCFFAGCCFGKVSFSSAGASFGCRFPEASMAFQDMLVRHLLPELSTYTPPLHPTQLYEAAGELALFALLVHLARRPRPHFAPVGDGRITLVYLGAYSALRFVIEIFRGDVVRTFVRPLYTPAFNRALGLAPDEPSFLSTAQAIALFIIVAVAIVALRKRLRPAAAADPAADPADSADSADSGP